MRARGRTASPPARCLATIALALLSPCASACTTPSTPATTATDPPAAATLATTPGAGAADAGTREATEPTRADDRSDAGPDAAASLAADLPRPPSPADAAIVLLPDAAMRREALDACATGDDAERTRCLLRRAYAADTKAAAIAVALFERSGIVVGVEAEQDMDGGYRGMLHLVPELPIGRHRGHLAWIDAASRDQAAFFAALVKAATSPVHYRVAPLTYRVFRSVGRHTPAAYAGGWTIAYNVSGSLNTSEAAVRETLFHELFHLNDAAHGDWSMRTLAETHAAIVAKCGKDAGCLRPLAPNDTLVRGGTYYAFQPGNDAREYAAELAVRYYREHRARLGVGPGRPPPTPFKCGPPENARAWAALVAEFFGGVDRTEPCRN